MKLIRVSLSLDLLADNLYITIWLLHKKLKKTKIITKTNCIVDSTYTVSYPDRRTSCNMSIERPSGATLDNWKGGGGISKNRYITNSVSDPLHFDVDPDPGHHFWEYWIRLKSKKFQ